MRRPKHKEKITMLRSIVVSAASFALTAVLIVGTGAQGSAIFG
jgi:hypothetical protein